MTGMGGRAPSFRHPDDALQSRPAAHPAMCEA